MYFKPVLVLEVIDELLKGRVVWDLKSVPKSPLGLTVLFISSILLQFVEGRTFCLAASIGSEKPKNGRARLTKPFL